MPLEPADHRSAGLRVHAHNPKGVQLHGKQPLLNLVRNRQHPLYRSELCR